jgi:hypothetical protein
MEVVMKCGFCGFEFDECNSKSGCAGCPMNGSCKKIKCPNCNYEMYPEPQSKILDTIKKWSNNAWKK